MSVLIMGDLATSFLMVGGEGKEVTWGGWPAAGISKGTSKLLSVCVCVCECVCVGVGRCRQA